MESSCRQLGEIKLQAGDFLLLATGPDFATRQNLNKNFFILSEQKIARPLTNKQEWITLGGFLSTVLLAATNVISLAIGLLFLAAVLIGVRVTSNGEMKRNLPLNLIVVIVGALSLATALENSGVINITTEALMPVLSGTDWFIALLVIYLLTLVLTEFVTNNAAAALMFPFVTGAIIGVPLRDCISGSICSKCQFYFTVGYQTNLLVYNAANYKFSH